MSFAKLAAPKREQTFGTVTSVSVVSANGLAGTVATATSTPAITMSVTFSGIAKANGTALSAAVVGTDYSGGTSLLATGILKSTTGTGALTIAVAGDFPTLNQNTTGSAATLTTGRTIAITGDIGYTSPSFDGSANVTAAGTLATVNSNVGSFGSATKASTFTVNGKGLLTAAGETTITPAVGSILGLGTGVATALAVNVGSNGAPVVFNGAGGTPSSLTLTNATGLLVAGGGTGLSTLAANNVILGNGTSAVQFVAPGTAGNVLTSNGTTWASSVAPASFVPIATATASSVAAVDFTSGITNAYDEYEIHLINVVPSVDGGELFFRTSSDGGSTFDSGASDYAYSSMYVTTAGGTPSGVGSTGTTAIKTAAVGVSSTASEAGICGIFRITNPSSSTTQKNVIADHCFTNAGGAFIRESTSGTRLSNTAVNALRILFNSGNVASGVFNLYGVKRPT
jgi:hypothetical protein